MRRLIWAFAGRTYQVVGNLAHFSKINENVRPDDESKLFEMHILNMKLSKKKWKYFDNYEDEINFTADDSYEMSNIIFLWNIEWITNFVICRICVWCFNP